MGYLTVYVYSSKFLNKVFPLFFHFLKFFILNTSNSFPSLPSFQISPPLSGSAFPSITGSLFLCFPSEQSRPAMDIKQIQQNKLQ